MNKQVQRAQHAGAGLRLTVMLSALISQLAATGRSASVAVLGLVAVAAVSDGRPRARTSSGRLAYAGRLPTGELIVLAGLPGAGKTTLLRRLAADSDVRALDSEDVARTFAAVPAPYRLLRPLVHSTHLLLVAVAAWRCRTTTPLLTTDPMTSPLRRQLFRMLAAITARRLVVVVLDVDAAQARAGQRARGRMLSDRRMTRHERRYDDLQRTVAHGALTLTRDSAAQVRHVSDLRLDHDGLVQDPVRPAA